jgi:hypothetical protein
VAPQETIPASKSLQYGWARGPRRQVEQKIIGGGFNRAEINIAATINRAQMPLD